ncbi:MAG TPA: dihydrolipoamide acetyltransferase family protein [Alphaproteobacteria bacterium]|nr:dihydrolipoamide acetyltransferase family protein [Alphaproteobacteria bacterium]
MPIDVYMPQLSPTMTEGRLAKWLKKEGDAIKAGDVIAEVETDKATMEVEASDDGILHSIIGQPGADMMVGEPIAVLKKSGENIAADYKPVSKAKPKDEAAPQAAATPAPVAVAAPIAVAQPVIVQQVAAPVASGGRVKASPLARRLASQKGLDLSSVQGTGPQGRITAKDLANAGGTRSVVRRGDALEKLSPMRKAIASKLTASKQTVPHFYLKVRANVARVSAMRAELNEGLASKGVKLTINDFIVKASALALADYPAANAAWNIDSMVMFGNVDMAVAVATPGGLITPIVRNADQKSLVQISSEVKQLAATAREGKLKPEQYEGGSFSISNLGMYGIEEFAAIINPPQAAILAVGKADENDMLALTLSVDHRVIDGALGAELLGAIKEYLEKPSLMLV